MEILFVHPMGQIVSVVGKTNILAKTYLSLGGKDAAVMISRHWSKKQKERSMGFLQIGGRIRI